MNLLGTIRSRFVSALQGLADDPQSLMDLIRPSQNPQFGDYQANLAMPLGKKLGRPPRDVAQEIIDRLEISDICHDPEIAGPGFINLKLKDESLAKWLGEASLDERLGVAPADPPLTYVVDFSSPNVAKPMHVGHIRSTVIGDSLARTLRFLGHNVITDNHLGDWGTQFGMIIYGYKNFLDTKAYQENPIGELSRLYREVRNLMDYHEGVAKLPEMNATLAKFNDNLDSLDQKLAEADKPTRKKLKSERSKLQEKTKELSDKISSTEAKIASVEGDADKLAVAKQHANIGEAVLAETAKLHEGDEENLRLWNEVLPHSMKDLHRIYDKLGVTFDHEYGESHYHDMLPTVVEDFEKRGLAKQSDGATCVFMEGFDTPMIIRKKDGAFLYATSDLATIKFRMDEFKPDVVLYVVDHRQHEHFEKLFAAARHWGFENVDLRHVSFGTVLGEDGKPIKTRAGDTIGLESLVDRAIEGALNVVKENSKERVTESDYERVSEIVGIGALKYADLSQNRISDYRFSYDNMLAMVGDTGPYLQYSYARNRSIFDKAGVKQEEVRNVDAPILLNQPEERALAISLLRFEEALHDVTIDYRPNLLCGYVFQLSKSYSSFFDRCPVIKAESEDLKQSRLRLCDLTARTVKLCLELLGIKVVDRM